MFTAFALVPGVALAFSLSSLLPLQNGTTGPAEAGPVSLTDLPALQAALNVDPNPGKGSTDIALSGGVALLPQTGPSGTMADIGMGTPSNQISIYTVRPGDTLSEIGAMYGVSSNTILWANDLSSANDIHPGDTLVILPVSGVEHVVAKGETLASIVSKYHGTMQDVLDYNHLQPGATVAVGDTIIIPDGVDGSPIPTAPALHQGIIGGTSITDAGAPGCISHFERLVMTYNQSLPGYFMRPLAGGVKTQCLHGYNAVDFGTPPGTPIMASASGTVIVARNYGYNGGYGEYIVINHPNGTQTVYAHLSHVMVSPGQYVEQGQIIAHSGNTGNSTGPHLHFEIRGAANPF
ncbi:MAG: peptidoglycan DD-metalloendopeptidase family protein [Patescibacteria group bacterium]|nr:peptidoglycan DD-metalloendopeptidase family protein [Patescibacteria group bacterium]